MRPGTNNGFVQYRRGLFEHLREGRMTGPEFMVFSALLFLAKADTGTWYGSSLGLMGHFGDGSLSQRQARGILQSLEAKRYIRRLRTQGQRGNYPILIDKFLLTSGVLKGQQVNATRTANIDSVAYEVCTERVGEDVPEDVSEHETERVTYNNTNNETETNRKQQVAMPAVAAAPSLNPRNVLSSVPANSGPARLIQLLLNVADCPDSLRNDPAKLERMHTAAVAALKQHDCDSLISYLGFCNQDEGWREKLTRAAHPMSYFVKSIPHIQTQMRIAKQPAVRPKHKNLPKSGNSIAVAFLTKSKEKAND